jgi:hypothetical protein
MVTWQAKHGDTRVLADCVGIGKCGTQDVNDNLLRCRLLTQPGHFFTGSVPLVRLPAQIIQSKTDLSPRKTEQWRVRASERGDSAPEAL